MAEARERPTRSKEAVMKSRTMIALMILGLVISRTPLLRGSETGPEAMIAHARDVVQSPHFSRDDITKALVDVLEASLLILPKTDYAEEFRSRVETVQKMFGEKEIFAEKARQYLGLSYKLVAGGNLWQIPAELKAPESTKKGIERATEICVKLLDSALAERKAGRSEQSVRYLLEFVLLVITPIEA
jgi:hypothetical protein